MKLEHKFKFTLEHRSDFSQKTPQILPPQVSNRLFFRTPVIKVHVANMGPTWGRQDVGPMNIAIRDYFGEYQRCYDATALYVHFGQMGSIHAD